MKFGEKKTAIDVTIPTCQPTSSGGIVIWEIIVVETQLSDRSPHLQEATDIDPCFQHGREVVYTAFISSPAN